MPTFAYEVIDQSGQTLKGRLEADNQDQVVAQLIQRRLLVMNLSRVGGSANGDLFLRWKKVNLQALAVFSRQFATMINAGIAISRVLEILGNQIVDPVLKPAIIAARQDLLSGSSLTEALARHPKCFSPLYISMIRAAEAGGILDSTLHRLSVFLEKELEIRQKIKSALMYPCVILFFSLMVTTALMIFILPKFLDIFNSMNVELPVTTRALFWISNALQQYWYLVIFSPFILAIAVTKYAQTPRGRWQMDALKMNLILVGPLTKKMAISRFARTFSTLINSGVPMMKALDIVAESSGNVVLSHAIMDARGSVREGQKISPPLQQSGLFPTMVCQMIDIGEETGRLSDMLNKVSDFYDSEVDAAIKGLTSMIEPIMIVGLGILVGFIAISLMSPIFALQKALATDKH